MEGVGESYGDFMEIKQTMKSNNGKNDDKNRKSCSIGVAGLQGVNRHGIPQAHLGRSQSPFSQLPTSENLSNSQTQNLQTQKPSHCRSVSQPAFLTVEQNSSTSTISGSVPEGQFFDRLPPISPASAHMPKRRGVAESSCGNMDVGGFSARRGHRRTCSEVPYVFSQMDQKEGLNRDGDLNMEGVELGDNSMCNLNYERKNGKSLDGGGEAGTTNEASDFMMRSAEGCDGTTHLRADSGGSVKEKNNNDKDVDWISSDDEADSEVNLQSRNAATLFEKGKAGHNRSVSMDSILSNNIHGLNSGKDLKLSPSRQNQSGRDFRRSSTDGNINLKMELNGEFTEAELKKILSNEKLTEIARSDPRRAKRILANRLSAARSKERKMLYMTELEGKVQTLQTEATTLSAQLTLLQRDLAGLANENSGLKLRLQGMEQQAQLQDALNKALMEEVQRLKLATGQPVAEQSTGLAHQMSLSPQLFQFQQHGLQHQQHVEDSVHSSGQNQNGTFQNSNNAFQQLIGSVKQDAQNICAGYGNNH